MSAASRLPILLLGPLALGALGAAQSTVTLVSSSTGGGTSTGQSDNSFISPCGRFVAFESDAADVTADDDQNDTDDVFLHDGLLGTTTLVSRAVGGGTGDGPSRLPSNPRRRAFSQDGRFFLFYSRASDLTGDADTNDHDDLFLYDRVEDSLRLVSKAHSGGACDGGTQSNFEISADGRYVVFDSTATDLTPQPDGNGSHDVFLYDRLMDTVVLVSTALGGGPGDDSSRFPLLSADGSTVAFDSRAHDLTTDTFANGRQSFLWDRASATITLISKSAPGVSGAGNSTPTAISSDGRRVVIESDAGNLTADTDHNGSDDDLFLYDADEDSLTLISTGVGGGTADANSMAGEISGDGAVVAFESQATNLTADPNHNGTIPHEAWDVYAYIVETGALTLVSRAVGGGTGDLASESPVLSADGRFIAFQSAATDLTADPNLNESRRDVYLFDRADGSLRLLSPANDGSGTGDNTSDEPRISSHGRYVAFESESSDLTPDIDNDPFQPAVFRFDLLGPDVVGSPYCSADGSGAVCPCDNPGAPGEGCANSTGAGARLAGSGSPGVAADDLVLAAEGLPAGQPALLFAGEEELGRGNGVSFGDGLRCAGGAVVRLGIRNADAQGAASWGPGLAPIGGWEAGDGRAFQVWYRDPFGGPCGSTFNLSNGVAVCFAQ